MMCDSSEARDAQSRLNAIDVVRAQSLLLVTKMA